MSPLIFLRSLRRLLAERRGGTAIISALLAPAMVGFAGLTVDTGLWYRQYERLQLAADAAALGAGRLLTDASATTADYQAAGLAEVNGITGGKLVGTLTTPITVSVGSNQQSVTVTLTSTANSYFSSVFSRSPPVMTASATAGSSQSSANPLCVLATSKTAQDAIDVDNSGSITAGTGCGIFANSTASNAIYLNSGTVSATTVGTSGQISESNSGSNSLGGKTSQGAAAQQDPFASKTAPTPGSCNNPTNNFTAYGTYNFTQSANIWCGDVTIGGNGSTDTFAPGVYYVVNGNLIFNNADITSAAGVTFVLTGTTEVGGVEWTNYSNTTSISAPTTGATAGIVFWQTCADPSNTAANTFNGGGTLELSGSFYAACGALNASNNAKIEAAGSSAMSVVASTIYATGSAAITAATSQSGSGSSGTGSLVLLQ
ncbi:MAG: hypothetical protein JO209_03375 [Acidisphaera sp.]|nr:hypothetical protein [Acidisphaera sp.]